MRKKVPLKLLLIVFIAITISSNSNAQLYESGGIKYSLNELEKTATVIENEPEYSGEITIPSTIQYNLNTYTVTGLGSRCFQNCNDINSVSLPNTIISIGDYSFFSCTGLTSIQIPNSVTSIGYRAFDRCSGLTSLIIPNSVSNIGKNAFASCSGLTSLTIGNSITSIGESVFANCISLTNLVIPNPVSSIGYRAFNGCTGLTSVSFGESLTSIGLQAFVSCTGLTSLIIPNTIQKIESRAFFLCSGLTSVTIGNSVSVIKADSFEKCINLTEINVDEENNYYSSVNGILFNKNKSDLVKYPEGIQGEYSIPGSVKNINYEAFSNCTKLTSLKISTSVDKISNYAFKNCTGLTSVFCYAQVPISLYNETQFRGVDLSKVTLYVPSASIDAYKAATVWKNFDPIKAIVEVTGISLNKRSLTLNPGSEETFTATIYPENANNKTLSWNSSNEEIAKVDSTGKVTAMNEGNTIITATTAEGNFKASCYVLVEKNKNTTTIETIEKAKVSFYPNPTNGLLNYAFKNNSIQKIMVSDISGRNILTHEVKNSEGSIDLSAHEPGIYIIHVYTEKEVLTSKIIKE